MTTGENIQILADGGYTDQAVHMANAQSVAIEEMPNGSTVYTFADGSTFIIYGLAPL